MAAVAVVALAACTAEEPTARSVPTTTDTVASTGATPTPAAVETGPAEGRGFTLVATGDVLLHPPMWAQARQDARSTGRRSMDFEPMMAAIRPYVAGADVGLCHLETPLAGARGPFAGYPSFSVPPQIAPALKNTGYDVCSTASNHTLDKGGSGVGRTLDWLDAAGLRHTGSARTPAEARRTTILDANGVRVAVLSYTYGMNGHPVGSFPSWRTNVIAERRILADARKARRRGAQAVVLAMHWGTEYQQQPNVDQARLAPRLARSGLVDLIISHHAHVVEPVTRIGRTWVVYGLGNVISNQTDPSSANAEGLLVRFTFTRRGGRFVASRAEYVPLLMSPKTPRRVLDVRESLRSGQYGTATRARLRTALRRTTTVVRSLGGADQGLRYATAPAAAPVQPSTAVTP